jgi:preprotein translocase subunit SecA
MSLPRPSTGTEHSDTRPWHHAASADAERELAGAQRLWPSLAAQPKRRTPSQGFDVAGETFAGWRAQRSAKKLDWARVRSIIAKARSLGSWSQAAFDEQISAARTLAMTDRDGRETIDLAFAVSYEAIRREIGLSLHEEQVLGALALAEGRCAELATGEGKTLTAFLPAALDGWTGRGVHVVTVNDYLARRDAQTTSPAYRRLGISVGVLQESTTHENRLRAYAADITYASDKQIIFDYLRDQISSPASPRLSDVILDGLAGPGGRHADGSSRGWPGRVVQRGQNAAIIDEADSVLIDEAVTPAIISLPGDLDETALGLAAACEIARTWRAGAEYRADTRLRTVELTQSGRESLAARAHSLPPFWSGPRRREELILQALSAKELYQLGDDYVINDGKIMIVDRSTGRVLPGRQWQLGLHQAVETKEGLELTAATHVAARSSYQAYYQRYRRLAGMTGTAREVKRELWRWYRLTVVEVPTHRPVARTVVPDKVFATEQEKLAAAAARAEELHRQGRPVLVGAWSVNTSERVSAILESRGVPHRVLNALREAEEAAIVEQAGQPGAVTVATNMAGRGTDITLTPRSRELGGLVVLATERHDESRVDRQLAGRAGRQGDPGAVEVFTSLEDKVVTQNGLRMLRWLAANGVSALKVPFTRLLWWQAQNTASRKWTTIRAQVASADSWLEMAMHHLAR